MPIIILMITTAKHRKVSERSLANLKPFKPGQSGNPKGMPKQTLTRKEKRQLLAQYAKMNPEKANPVEAIRELNRMDREYELPIGGNDNRQYTIIIQGDEAKLKLEQLLSGKIPELEAEGVAQD